MLVDDQLFTKPTEDKKDSTKKSTWGISIRQQGDFLKFFN